MKKWKVLLAATALTLGLAACNETAEPKESSTTEKSEMTLQEVYAKSIEVSEQLTSMSAQVILDQKMSMPGEGEMTLLSDLNMDFVIEPMQLYQKGTTSMSMGEGNTESMDIEAYMTNDAFYMFEGNSKQWMKMPLDMAEMMGTAEQTTPADQLEMLEEYIDEFTFEQDDESYILTMNASGEKFTNLIREQVQEAMQGMAEDEELNMDYNINSLNYLIHIDKESYQTTKVDMVMDMDLTMDGESAHMVQDIKATYSNFNEVDNIAVPQEVIDSAIEI